MSVQRNKTLYQHIFPSQGYIFSLLFQRAQSRTFTVRKEGWYLPLLNWLRHQKGFWPYRQLLQSMESTIIEPGLKFWGSQANQLNLHLKMWGKTSSSGLYFSGTYTVKKGYQLIMETLIKIQTTIQTKGKLGNTSGMLAPKEAIHRQLGRDSQAWWLWPRWTRKHHIIWRDSILDEDINHWKDAGRSIGCIVVNDLLMDHIGKWANQTACFCIYHVEP